LQKLPEPYCRLRIGNSKGIATDEEFIVSHFEYDGLLSDSIEFLHDHFFHIIRLIFRVYNATISGDYAKEKSEQTATIKAAYEKIKAVERVGSEKVSTIEIQQAMKMLALALDIINSKTKLMKLPTLESLDQYISTLLDGKTLLYFAKSFKETDITGAKLMLVWCKIMNFPCSEGHRSYPEDASELIEVDYEE
jgi:hypothetical protein